MQLKIYSLRSIGIINPKRQVMGYDWLTNETS